MLVHPPIPLVGAPGLSLSEVAQPACGSFANKPKQSKRVAPASAVKTRKQFESEEGDPQEPSRRQILLHSWNYAVLGTAISGSNDATTIVNSILGGKPNWSKVTDRLFKREHQRACVCYRSLWIAKVEGIQRFPLV